VEFSVFRKRGGAETSRINNQTSGKFQRARKFKTQQANSRGISRREIVQKDGGKKIKLGWGMNRNC
jgi:hypothetical protein